MGFLDNLLRREVRKVISSAVDTAVDSVVNNVFGKDGQSSGNTAEAAVGDSTALENKRATKLENCSGEQLLRQRIEEIAAREKPEYELRQRIPASEVGAPEGARPFFDYGFYRDGALVMVIMIIYDNNMYRRKDVVLAQRACQGQRVKYINLMAYMMNRPEYISQRLKANLP